MEANIEKGTKICSRCKEEKPLSEFYTSTVTKDGYRPQCKACSKLSGQETKQRMKERREASVMADKELKANSSYRKLTLVEKKQLLLSMRSDKPLSAYHPRELFEYLQSLGYKIKATFTQELTFG
jgi:hypothetical protein